MTLDAEPSFDEACVSVMQVCEGGVSGTSWASSPGMLLSCRYSPAGNTDGQYVANVLPPDPSLVPAPPLMPPPPVPPPPPPMPP